MSLRLPARPCTRRSRASCTRRRTTPPPLDYGPVIILKHETDQLDSFYTLYGHLTRQSLAANPIGRRVAAGDAFAAIGPADVNGGWSPHLHFQVIVALLDLGVDFPGVCRASQRRIWQAFSPDPQPVPARARCVVPGAGLRQRRRGDRAAHPHRLERRSRLSRSGAGRARLDAVPLRRERAALPRRVQQRAARRPLPPARRPRGVGADAPSSTRTRATCTTALARLRRASDRDAARSAARLLLRQLRQRGQRARAASRARAHGPARRHRARRRLSRQHDDAHRHQPVQVRRARAARARRRGCTSLPVPDVYRGEFNGRGRRRAVRRRRWPMRSSACRFTAGRRLCGFIAESCPSVGGQIVLPAGYLADVYARVRAAGGVCIADEVQTAYGRMGTHFYAFEAQGVVPDIVVLGQADRQRLSARRGGHDAGDRRVVRQRHGVLQHVRRQHRVVRRRARGARRGAARSGCRRTRAASAHSCSTGLRSLQARHADRRRRARLGPVPRRRARHRPRHAGARRPPKRRSSSTACAKRGS